MDRKQERGSLCICQQVPNHKEFMTDKCVCVCVWGGQMVQTVLKLMTSQILSKL